MVLQLGSIELKAIFHQITQSFSTNTSNGQVVTHTRGWRFSMRAPFTGLMPAAAAAAEPDLQSSPVQISPHTCVQTCHTKRTAKSVYTTPPHTFLIKCSSQYRYPPIPLPRLVTLSVRTAKPETVQSVCKLQSIHTCLDRSHY